MSKKVIKDENGKEYVAKEKKPFYKKWWFWGLIALIAIMFVGCGDDDSSSSSDSSSAKTEKTASSKSSSKSSDMFKVGQTASFDDVDVTINSVEYKNAIGDETPDDGNVYCVVNVTMKNNGDETVDYNECDFKFNNNGDLKESTTVSSDANVMDYGEIDKGATITKDVIGEVPTDVDKANLKLVYQPNSYSDKKITFTLNQ